MWKSVLGEQSVAGKHCILCIFALAGSQLSLGNLSTQREKKVIEVWLLTKHCASDNGVSSCCVLQSAALLTCLAGEHGPCDVPGTAGSFQSECYSTYHLIIGFDNGFPVLPRMQSSIKEIWHIDDQKMWQQQDHELGSCHLQDCNRCILSPGLNGFASVSSSSKWGCVSHQPHGALELSTQILPVEYSPGHSAHDRESPVWISGKPCMPLLAHT